MLSERLISARTKWRCPAATAINARVVHHCRSSKLHLIMSEARRRTAGKQSNPLGPFVGSSEPTRRIERSRKAKPIRFVIAGLLVLGGIYILITKGLFAERGLTRNMEPLSQKIRKISSNDEMYHLDLDEAAGHADFGDGRKRTAKHDFLEWDSDALYWVNVNLGNAG